LIEIQTKTETKKNFKKNSPESFAAHAFFGFLPNLFVKKNSILNLINNRKIKIHPTNGMNGIVNKQICMKYNRPICERRRRERERERENE